MEKLILSVILLLVASIAEAGNDIEFEIKIDINPNGTLNKPSYQLGKGKVQYRLNDRTLELGKLRWSHKYRDGIYHKDEEKNFLDIKSFKMYNLSQ